MEFVGKRCLSEDRAVNTDNQSANIRGSRIDR